MSRSPRSASAVRSASSVTSSAFPPSCPAKRSPVALKPPRTEVGPVPPWTAAPSRTSRSAAKRPPRKPASLGAKAANGVRSTGFTRSVIRSGAGTRFPGSGGAWTLSSKSCALDRMPAVSTTSSGAPAASPSTVRSMPSMKSSWPPAATSTKATRAPRTAACSTRTMERSTGLASPAAGAGGCASSFIAAPSRWTLVEPSSSRSTATRSPSSSALRTRTSWPPERRARRSSSLTSARSSSRMGRGSPGPAPIRTPSARMPNPVRRVSFTAPISTGRRHWAESCAAMPRAAEVRTRSMVKAATAPSRTSTAATAARNLGQRRDFGRGAESGAVMSRRILDLHARRFETARGGVADRRSAGVAGFHRRG